MPDSLSPEDDAPNLKGVRVSAAMLGEVFTYAKATSEGVIVLNAKIDQMADAVKLGTASQIRTADIMEERLRVDKEDREAERELEKAKSARQAEIDKAEIERQTARDAARFKIVSSIWAGFQDNWKLIAVAVLFTVNPQSFKAARDMGLLTLVGFPPVVEAQVLAPAPVAPPVVAPVEEPEAEGSSAPM